MTSPVPDGTTVARNPVIRGFMPDPSMIRVGDWYYVANSSFEWFPTIPIHRSRDLAHWEYAGHVQGAAPGGSLAGVPDSGGIWAPSMSWDGERFWMVYAVVRSVGTPYFDLDTYITTASDSRGPWTPPRRVASHGFDPALFHEDGRLWLLNLQNDHRPGGQRFSGIVLTELDPASLAPVDETRLLLQHDRLIEGPKVCTRNGWYYLTLAEGGTGFEHGVRMARSRSLGGPYELDTLPLLTTRDDATLPLQKAGHGELVQTPHGQWVLCHLAARPLQTAAGPRCTLGRETAIQAITWDEEQWPRLQQGGWHPATEVTVATTPCAPPSPRQAEPTSLNWPWSTLREPPSSTWADTTTRPGWIRLRGRHGPESRWEQSLLAQRLTEHHATAQVTVDARPRTFTQAAGLILRYDAAAYLSLDLTWTEPDGEAQRGQQWQSAGRVVLSLVERDEHGARQAALQEIEPNNPVTLGVTITGTSARFWYATDGQRTQIGLPLDCTRLSDDHGGTLRFTGTLVGIHARDLVDASFTADFRDFRLACRPCAESIGLLTPSSSARAAAHPSPHP
ncbi:family 43 glycosylhydrolase [Streptomyces griseoviridis]|uniref:Glycoside hydrolase 43 family protein n=1 Tax=Streptomyces griseoviridis TaxID=45398 RepID=A0A918GUB9_STRGD|nr:family 43 glycosylhydrolase [Streptomyces niveoruber]GGS60524.1 glycoside hydrolase 43 family protein [Streptomyces niveoruber]